MIRVRWVLALADPTKVSALQEELVLVEACEVCCNAVVKIETDLMVVTDRVQGCVDGSVIRDFVTAELERVDEQCELELVVSA